MRHLIGLATATMAAVVAVASPARAMDLPADVPPALPTGVTALAVASVIPAAAAVATGGALPDVVRIGIVPEPRSAAADDRLPALMQVMAAEPAAPADAATARLRRGFGGSMADYFPLGADGFHLSGGSRFWSRGPARAGVLDSRGLVDMRYITLLSAPRSVLARATRRMTPALTVGYTKLLKGGLSLGLEGGAMLGKFDSLAGALVRPPRLRGPGLGDGAGQLNQVARMTVGFRF